MVRSGPPGAEGVAGSATRCYGSEGAGERSGTGFVSGSAVICPIAPRIDLSSCFGTSGAAAGCSTGESGARFGDTLRAENLREAQVREMSRPIEFAEHLRGLNVRAAEGVRETRMDRFERTDAPRRIASMSEPMSARLIALPPAVREVPVAAGSENQALRAYLVRVVSSGRLDLLG